MLFWEQQKDLEKEKKLVPPKKREYVIGRRWHDFVTGLLWVCLGIMVGTLVTCRAKFLTIYMRKCVPRAGSQPSEAEFFHQPEGWKNKRILYTEQNKLSKCQTYKTASQYLCKDLMIFHDDIKLEYAHNYVQTRSITKLALSNSS